MSLDAFGVDWNIEGQATDKGTMKKFTLDKFSTFRRGGQLATDLQFVGFE